MHPRLQLAAGVVVVVIVAGVVVLATAGGDSDGGRESSDRVRTVRATLKLEQFQRPDTGEYELLVSSPGAQFNRADFIRGTPIVALSCFDSSGAQAIRVRHDWPLLEEPGYPPHIHQPADRTLLERIRRCRLTGAGIDFEGTVPGELPVAQ